MTLRCSLLASLAAITLLTACAEPEEEGGDALVSCEGEVFVAGTVTREMRDTNWNEPFVPSADAHVVMTLGDFINDGPTYTLAERDLPFSELPFEFSICADAEMVEAAQQGQLIIDMQIFNHAGDDVRVGDLVSEYLNSIDGPEQGVEILVSGIEHCDEPNAGGFCTTNEG